MACAHALQLHFKQRPGDKAEQQACKQSTGTSSRAHPQPEKACTGWQDAKCSTSWCLLLGDKPHYRNAMLTTPLALKKIPRSLIGTITQLACPTPHVTCCPTVTNIPPSKLQTGRVPTPHKQHTSACPHTNDCTTQAVATP